VSQRSRLTPGSRGVLPDATCRTTTHIANGGWRGSDFNVVAHCLLFFLQKQYQQFADADITNVLACSMVVDFQCPTHQPNSKKYQTTYLNFNGRFTGELG